MRIRDIKNTDPKREHGSIEELKKSIAEVGLINPLTIDENGNLIAGRRRYEALMELHGPDHEPDVRILPINGDQLKAFKISIDENLRRKNLSDPEVAAAIKEYDELKRKLEGEKPRGNPNLSRRNKLDGWSQAQTAKDLSISQPAVAKAIKIATAIEKYPELATKRKGNAILAEFGWKQRREEALQHYQQQRKEIEADGGVKCEDMVSPDGVHFKLYTAETPGVFSMWDVIDPNDVELHKRLEAGANAQLAAKLYKGTENIGGVINLLSELRRKFSVQEVREAYVYYPGVYRKRRPLPYEGFIKEVQRLSRELMRFSDFISDNRWTKGKG